MKSILLLSTIFAFTTFANEFYPKSLLQLNDFFSHHVIIAEKSTHSLYLYKNNQGDPELVQKFQMATGKKAGNKIFQGDHRTPEGIYNFTEFLTHKQLLKRHGKAGEIYGVGAFVMNYPNPIDIQKGKTGGGIWLHSTNDETRIDKGLDSRGCIVAHNKNLIDISEYIELHKTNMIVVHNLDFLSKSAWEKEKNDLRNTVMAWKSAWENENINEYISHYHKTDFHDARRGKYNAYRQYKRAVFARPGQPQIGIEKMSILKANGYAVVLFKQDYKSETINDIGKKTLYLKQDEYYQWKIVAEEWTKAGLTENENESYAFEPSMRFFNSKDPRQVFTKNINLTQPKIINN